MELSQGEGKMQRVFTKMFITFFFLFLTVGIETILILYKVKSEKLWKCLCKYFFFLLVSKSREISNSEKKSVPILCLLQNQTKQTNIQGMLLCYKEMRHRPQTERSSLLRKIYKPVLNIKYMLKPIEILLKLVGFKHKYKCYPEQKEKLFSYMQKWFSQIGAKVTKARPIP